MKVEEKLAGRKQGRFKGRGKTPQGRGQAKSGRGKLEKKEETRWSQRNLAQMEEEEETLQEGEVRILEEKDYMEEERIFRSFLQLWRNGSQGL